MEAEREDRKQRVAMREEERKIIDERRKIEEEKLVCTFGCDSRMDLFFASLFGWLHKCCVDHKLKCPSHKLPILLSGGGISFFNQDYIVVYCIATKCSLWSHAEEFVSLIYFQEEDERKRKEEQERREHEEYLLLKEQFTVEEEGIGETAEEVSVEWMYMWGVVGCPVVFLSVWRLAIWHACGCCQVTWQWCLSWLSCH